MFSLKISYQLSFSLAQQWRPFLWTTRYTSWKSQMNQGAWSGICIFTIWMLVSVNSVIIVTQYVVRYRYTDKKSWHCDWLHYVIECCFLIQSRKWPTIYQYRTNGHITLVNVQVVLLEKYNHDQLNQNKFCILQLYFNLDTIMHYY